MTHLALPVRDIVAVALRETEIEAEPLYDALGVRLLVGVNVQLVVRVAVFETVADSLRDSVPLDVPLRDVDGEAEAVALALGLPVDVSDPEMEGVDETLSLGVADFDCVLLALSERVAVRVRVAVREDERLPSDRRGRWNWK